jgi:hypothetical protein
MKKNISYSGIHKWLNYHYGNATKCENNQCYFLKPKRFEWALIKGKHYEKERKNFIMLCASCHRKYDMTREMMKGMLEQNIKNRIKISQLTKDGKFIKNWDSLTDASKALNINKSSISNCIRNKPKHKSCGGFIWKKL